MLTTTATFFAVFLVGIAAIEWIVIKQQSYGVAPVWGPFTDRLGYLVPIAAGTAIVHGALVELLGWFRRQQGKTAIRRLTMPVTAGIAGVVLMAFPSVPGWFAAHSEAAFGPASLAEYFLVPLGIGVLATALAVVLGATGGGLRGRQ